MDIHNYLWIPINELWISINDFWISINDFWISINELWISINKELILKRHPIGIRPFLFNSGHPLLINNWM